LVDGHLIEHSTQSSGAIFLDLAASAGDSKQIESFGQAVTAAA